MRRLRFYKILLPVVLVLFVVWLVRALDPPEASHTDLAQPLTPVNSVRDVVYSEFDGSESLVHITADNVEEEHGRVKLDDISRLEYFRAGREPLIFSAGHGEITGEQGQRVLRFENDVKLEDPEKELTVRIRNLEVDQEAQEARTTDVVTLEGASLSGRARGLVYGVNGQPGRVGDLELEDDRGTRLTANRAVLHDGLRDVELLDTVRIRRGEEFLNSVRMRIFRRRDDTIKRLEALDSVSAELRRAGGKTVVFDSDTLNIDFDNGGQLLNFEASSARIDAHPDRLEAETLRGRRVGAARHEWRVIADGEVLLENALGADVGRLRAESSVALLDQGFSLVEATASGDVRFDVGTTHAEADWAALFATRDEVRLVGSTKRKARLAHLDTRVAAERITTDSRGKNLVAEEQVEATLLSPGARGPARAGLFAAGSAIHFLAARLEGKDSGAQFKFTGAVRGWQGDRTLSAESVTLDQAAETLVAEVDVAARIPREVGGGTAESDYIQIGADHLTYSNKARVAEFEGDVRVQLAEGWVESRLLQASLSGETSAIELIEAEGDVRLEFHETSGEGPPRLMTGTSDRMKYDPTTATVWLMGDNAPATVRRVGADEGTTSGRVLRYRLDDGTLEVDSGASGPARIRTSER